MATPEQVADYIRQHKGSHPIEALQKALRVKNVPEDVIAEGLRLAGIEPSPSPAAAPPAAPPPAAPPQPLLMQDGAPAWRVRLGSLQEFRGVRRTLEFHLCFMPAGAVLCWVFRLFKDPQAPMQLCQVADPKDAVSKAVLEGVAERGKLMVLMEGPEAQGSFSVPAPCDGPGLAQILHQAASYNSALSRWDGPGALSEFVAVFAPAFQRSGFEAAWVEAERSAVRPADPGQGITVQAGPRSAEGLDASSSCFDSSLQGSQAREKVPDGAAEAADEEIERVLAGLDPDLYERNAFRAAELPPDAAASEFRKRSQLAEMAARTGAEVPAGPFRALPRADPDAGNRLRDALERLQDPWQRLLEEVFWFWPDPAGASTPALAALSTGDIEGACRVWEEARASGKADDLVIHNLAVLHHLAALSLEGAADQEPLIRHWHAAFECWQALHRGEAFWNRLAGRVRKLGDHRLGPHTVRSLRRLLPQTLLAINARLTSASAQRGDAAAAQRNAQLMKKFTTGGRSFEQALGTAAKPIRQRIAALCDACRDDLNNAAAKGYDLARKLLAETEPLLAVLDVLFPDGGLVRDSAHDDVAEQAFGAVVRCGNLDENRSRWEDDLDLYMAALGLCAGQATRQRIEGNLKKVKDLADSHRQNRVFVQCWFCGKPDISPPDVLVVALNRVTGRHTDHLGRRVIEYDSGSGKVPRCASCAGEHARRPAMESKARTSCRMGCGALMLLGSVALFGIFSSNKALGLIIGTALGMVAASKIAPLSESLGAAIWRFFTTKRCHGPEYGIEYPIIQKALKDGWKIGAEP